MNRVVYRLSAVLAALILSVGLVGSAAAQQRNDRQTRDLIRTLSSQIDNFQFVLDHELMSSSARSQDIVASADGIRALQDAVASFEMNFNDRRDNRDDVNDIVDAARNIETFLASEQRNQKITNEWSSIKANIGRLAGPYGVTPSWSGPSTNTSSAPVSRKNYPTIKNGTAPRRTATPVSSTISNSALTGTYKLDTSKSESSDQILAEANVDGANRQDLQKKLEAPEQIALDVRGNQVTFAASNSSPITFVADGSEKTDTDASGRTVKMKATLRGQDLTIASLGGETDYTIIFSPTDNGRTLKVTRRITTDYLPETVFADSFYARTADVAGLGIEPATVATNTDGGWSSSDESQPTGTPGPVAVPGRTGDFVVPNGTLISAQLENNIDTKASQNNDKFKMTVQSPMEYRGAVIEGHLSSVGRSGRVSGRSNVTFNFDTITLRDGKTYDFAGFLQSIKDHNGKPIRVDSEGVVTSGSQTHQTVKRGGIGAGLGAVIGAIAGGGTGAAIGAVIGGGVGAGSVIVQGRDDVQLMKGSIITLQASSPIRGSDGPSDQ
jgi:hypothetical protein